MEKEMKSMKLGTYEIHGKYVYMLPGEVEDMALRTKFPVPFLAHPYDPFSKAIGSVTGVWASGDYLMARVEMKGDVDIEGVLGPSIMFDENGMQGAFTHFFLLDSDDKVLKPVSRERKDKS